MDADRSLARSIARITKGAIRSVLPLSFRKRLCLYINQQESLSSDERYWWTLELLRDYADSDSDAYHRFLWSNHLAYAATYNVDARFGNGRIDTSRKIFFEDLETHLSDAGFHPVEDVRTVFEVGCSLGYQLRLLETSLFPGAVELAGIDIDRYAVDQGTDYLKRAGSRVRLMCRDMGDLEQVLDGKRYDVMICTGVLMYLEEGTAVRVVDTMLRHTGKMVGLSGPAHPETDNGSLKRSIARPGDGAFLHNLDSIVRKVGGTVIARRWEGPRTVDGHSIYFVFARGT